MNLSCLFGHSWKEETYNLIDTTSRNTKWFKALKKVCSCCSEIVHTDNMTLVEQDYYEYKIARSFFDKGETDCIIKNNSSTCLFTKYIEQYKQEALEKEIREAALKQRRIQHELDVLKLALERGEIVAGPMTGIPTRSY